MAGAANRPGPRTDGAKNRLSGSRTDCLDSVIRIDRSAVAVQRSADGGPRAGSVFTWARLIQRVWEVDPLTCSQSGGAMKIISFIGSGLRQVTSNHPPDVDNYRPVYLPDGQILFCSTANFQCVPCNGSHVALLYRMNDRGGDVRQLTFDQDHSFDPSVMPDGRVMYLRWEYSDLPHSNSRILFTMNPDGTGQSPCYGANSYWPNALFGARSIPRHPGMFVGIVAGHHDSYRDGELTLFDIRRGRHEASGAVQRIPGRGQEVRALVADRLTAESWPKFAHPYPLSDKYFLVSGKLAPMRHGAVPGRRI